MKQFIDKLIERLEEEQEYQYKKSDEADEFEEIGVKTARNRMGDCYYHAIEIVNQLAEEHKDDIQTIDVSELLGEQGNDGWIACSERLPEERFFDDGYVEPSEAVLVLTKYNSYKVSRYWGNRRNKRDYHDWVDIEYRKNEVIAWKPIAPYQPKGE